MSEAYVVNATLLNLRSAPVVDPLNVLLRLGQGQIVERIADAIGNWYKVRCQSLEGFVSSQYLSRLQTAAPVAGAAASTLTPPAVHFPESPSSTLSSTRMRHCPLAGAVIRPRAAGQSAADRGRELHDVLAFLDVEQSPRYQPSSSQTFCNIYVYDYSHLAGAYLPRVWWTDKALLQIAQGQLPQIVYAKTVRELTANDLYAWLSEWGDDFGWQTCKDANELQTKVNDGGVGVICAQRIVLSRSGHITAVVPETTTRRAERAANVVVRPLQSQAGARNKQLFANQWWIDGAAQFRASGFWCHS